MTEPTGRDQPRYSATINQAIKMAHDGDMKRAAHLMSDLVSEFRNAASAHGYFGWFLLQLGKHDEALEHSLRAVRLAPRSEKASLIHFHILWKAERHIDALDEMKRYLMSHPSKIYTEMIEKWQPDLERLNNFEARE